MEGLFFSYERELYDIVRSIMLKYYFQARLGCMDGVFVAYHNTIQIFGFQYLSCDEMCSCIFGSKSYANLMFRLVLKSIDKLFKFALDNYSSSKVGDMV